ncbi:hypothetical protein FGK63_01605 [Ruegeria sediminis]|uniref:Uncharacterized protein n=1 Tax=Ruegeria sediminis TaxID=2583820 RepID=A0ABY2X347_9RHOB|nr:hypothetical protein FGK63_01605 [Ruegeria sediminis]
MSAGSRRRHAQDHHHSLLHIRRSVRLPAGRDRTGYRDRGAARRSRPGAWPHPRRACRGQRLLLRPARRRILSPRAGLGFCYDP